MVDAILYLALLILFAKLFEEIALRLKQPMLLGEVLAGIVLGPSLLALVRPLPEIRLFIEIGIYFLFFLVGFEEIDIPSLLSVFGKRLFFASLVGFFFPFTVCLYFSLFIGLTAIEALLISSIIAISSLGVVAKILLDLGRLKDPLGLEIFSMVAILEFVGIAVASFFLQVASNPTEISTFTWLWTGLRIVLFLVVASFFGVFVTPKVLRLVERHLEVKEVFFGIVVAVLLIFVWFAEYSGLHGAIGALLLGIVLSDLAKEEAYLRIVSGLHSLAYGIFIPIFFAGLGLYFSASFLSLPILIITGFMAVVLLGKSFGGYIGAKTVKMTNAGVFGVSSLSKGGVDLALLLTLLELGIIGTEYFSLLTFITILIIVITPMALKQMLRRVGKLPVKAEVEETLIPLYARVVLAKTHAKDAMSSVDQEVIINSDMTVEECHETHLSLGYRHYFVTDKDGNLEGMVSITDCGNIPQKHWKKAKVKEIMRTEIAKAYPDESLHSVLEKMALHNYPRLPVVDPKNPKVILGAISKTDILKLIVPDKPSG